MSRTSENSAGPIFPGHKGQHMWSISLRTIFVSETVPGPLCGPFLYLSHEPASSKNKKSHGLKNPVPFISSLDEKV